MNDSTQTPKDESQALMSVHPLAFSAYESDMRDVALRCAVLDYADAQKAGCSINRDIIRQAIQNLEAMLEAN